MMSPASGGHEPFRELQVFNAVKDLRFLVAFAPADPGRPRTGCPIGSPGTLSERRTFFVGSSFNVAKEKKLYGYALSINGSRMG
jgi:hypothetical protein